MFFELLMTVCTNICSVIYGWEKEGKIGCLIYCEENLDTAQEILIKLRAFFKKKLFIFFENIKSSFPLKLFIPFLFLNLIML